MISVTACYAIIYTCGFLGVIYALINYIRVRKVMLKDASEYEMSKMGMGAQHTNENITLNQRKITMMLEIGENISNVST